jgi:hypothetical protein
MLDVVVGLLEVDEENVKVHIKIPAYFWSENW